MNEVNVYQHIKDILDYHFDDLPADLHKEGSNLINETLSNSKKQSQPNYLHVAGIPCAGKSTFIKNNLTSGVLGEDFVLISFDTIMLNLSGYKNELKNIDTVTTKNLAELFKKYEMPARIIGYELLQQSVNNKTNIVFENSGSFMGNLYLMEDLKKYGYLTIFHSIECTKETALKRVSAREIAEQRHTPKQMIEERFKFYEELKSKYQQLADKTIIHNNAFK